MPCKISFNLILLSWLSQYIFFKTRKKNNDFTDYQICCVFGTSATLRVGSPYVFSGKIYEFGNKNKKRYNFKTTTGKKLEF